MELKPGYKQTEVGGIPEDWEVQKLGSIATFLDGMRRPVKSSDRARMKGSIPYYGASGVVDYVDNYIFDEELVLLGEDGENILSRNLPLAFRISGKTWVNNHAHVIRPNPGISIGFLTEYLDSLNYESLNSGTAQPKLNQQNCLQIPVALPSSTDEQRAIATALSDVDALLDGLDRLIAKKRDLKQASMQQLLTGETRLPEFEGEWELKRLGDHVAFLRNGVNSRVELTLDDPVKYLHYGDIHSCTSVMLDPASLPSLPKGKAKNLDRLRDGDLVFVDASEDLVGVSKSVEICGASSTEIVSGLHTIAARFDKNTLANGFKGYLQFCPVFSGLLRRLAAGTKVYATNRSHIASVEMRLPGVKEQEAIAAAFNDMDAEIAALEQRRNKNKEIKQAMMQELLTGKTRLVTPGGFDV